MSISWLNQKNKSIHLVNQIHSKKKHFLSVLLVREQRGTAKQNIGRDEEFLGGGGEGVDSSAKPTKP